MSDVSKFYDNLVPKLSVENYRHLKVFQSIEKFIPKETRVLDLGCGAGLTSRQLAIGNRNVIAIDLSPKLVDYAKKHNSHFDRVKYICADITKIKLNCKFDAVVMVDVFEHLKEPKRIFNLIKSVSHETTTVYLNIPSPDTIRFLQENYPDLLQIIDNPVEVSFIIENFKKIGFIPAYFNFYWYQYIEYFFVKENQFNKTLEGLYGNKES